VEILPMISKSSCDLTQPIVDPCRLSPAEQKGPYDKKVAFDSYAPGGPTVGQCVCHISLFAMAPDSAREISAGAVN
jgi:hypothetical protein